MSLRNFGEEISLRHLPDESDASFSFQIPGSIPDGDLLADDGLDFFQGANISTGPPHSPRTRSNAPLTLSQVTPRPATPKNAAPPELNSPLSFPTDSTHCADDKLPFSKQDKPTSRARRPPKLSKINTEAIGHPRPRSITPSVPRLPPAEGSPAGAHLEAIRAQVNSLSEDLHVRSSDEHKDALEADIQGPKGIKRPSLEKIRPNTRVEKRERQARTRQKIAEGGITKFKSIYKQNDQDKAMMHPGSSSTIIGNNVFSQQRHFDIPKDLHGDEKSLADSSISSLGDDGSAARLVQYSQKLITSFGHGLFGSDTVPGVNERPTASKSLTQEASFRQDPETGTDMKFTQQETAAAVDADDDDGPLTVSQLSPRKTVRAPTPTPPANKAASPPVKRPLSVASETRQRKKSRTDAPAPNAPATTFTAVRGATSSTGSIASRASSRAQPRLNSSDSASVCSTDRGAIKAGKAASSQAPGIKGGNSAGNEATHVSASSAASLPRSSTSNLRNSRKDDTIDPGKQASSLKGKNKAAAASSLLSSSKTLSRAPLRATRPVEFKLLTESRLEARTRPGGPGNESTSSQSRSRSHREKRRIPDFKAMHAAQEAELALRKENIHPTVPLAIKWETEERLKERQRFDEMIREKEREQARVMEERRREQEEQEERELRELRKKAIPKANEVPEWYKEAPKKKEKTISGIGR